jgi:hypothetical protein
MGTSVGFYMCTICKVKIKSVRRDSNTIRNIKNNIPTSDMMGKNI